MMRRGHLVIWLVLLLLQLCPRKDHNLVVSAVNWGSFSRDKCIQPGYRQYSARLWNIKGDWGSQCDSMSATVKDTYFIKPDNCVNKGFLSGEWGEFHVVDTSCNPDWGSFHDDGCKGDGRRQFSSILWNIPDGKRWEDWCARSWAFVDGVFFLQPSRCVNKVFHMWGEFDVPDPCCGNGKADDSTTAPIHDQLKRRRLLSTCAAAGGGGGFPPYDNNGLPKTPTDACDAFAAQDFDADELAGYLIINSPNNAQFLVAGGSSGGEQSFDVFIRSTSDTSLRFFPTSSQMSRGALRSHSIRALVVPVTQASQLTSSTYTIPSGRWYSISLSDNAARLQPTRIIATSQLSGCCLSMGWDSSSRTLYMGHVQPDKNSPQPFLQTGENLANYLRQIAQPFDGVTLNPENIYHIGATSERFGGYGADGLVRANVIGLIGRNAIQIVVQFVNQTSRLVEGFRDMPFF